MILKFNIAKDYIVNEPIEATFKKLNTIVTANYDSSMYSTFGRLVSLDTLQFIILAKWYSIGKPIYAELSYTRLKVTLHKLDNKTKISIATRTRMPFLILYLIVTGVLLFRIVTLHSINELFNSVSLLAFCIVIFFIDKFLKNILVERFEKDLQLLKVK